MRNHNQVKQIIHDDGASKHLVETTKI